MFQLDGVTRKFPGTTAVDDVSLTVEDGEQVALIGPSGAGKTTILKLLVRLEEPDEGTLLIDGQPGEAYHPGNSLAHRVGLMQQEFNLVDELPAIHNVQAGNLGRWGFLRSLWRMFVPRVTGKAEKALERVGMLDRAFARTGDLSGGEKQRIALARLLVQEPRAILADEPVASVDPAHAHRIMELLCTIAEEEKFTLITSLHDVSLAQEYFPRIIALHRGRIVFDRPPGEISDRDLRTVYWEEADAAQSTDRR